MTYETQTFKWVLWQIFCNVCFNSLYYDAQRSNRLLSSWLQSHPKMQQILQKNDLDDTLAVNAAEFARLIQKRQEEILMPRTTIVCMDYFSREVCKLLVIMNFVNWQEVVE